MEQFQCNIDKWGNLWVASGWVYQLASQMLEESGADNGFRPAAAGSGYTATPGMASTGPTSATFIGGSGRLLIATPSVTLSDPDAQQELLGYYLPLWSDSYLCLTNGGMSLKYTSTTAATISDGTNIIAEWASGADAPLGTYAATAFGKTAYNGGDPFNIVITEELTGGRLPAPAWVEVSAGTALGGLYDADGPQSWELGSWSIVIDADGVAELKYLTNVVATRTTQDTWDDPSGTYSATAYGKTNYNSGNPFTVKVIQRNAYPRPGYAILKINISGGDLVSVSKPYFAVAVPANTSTEIYVPVFYSDGSTIAQQLHTGMLIIP